MKNASELLDRLRQEIWQDLIFIPQGVTTLGDEKHPEESLIREIFLSEFEIGSHLVTNLQYVTFLNALKIRNGQGSTYLYLSMVNKMQRIRDQNYVYGVQPGFERHPVTLVNWAGAYAFSLAVGGRLPTEAEWEKASRGGLKDNVFPWGDNPPSSVLANFGENVGATTEVGSYPPNGYGLYDMAGNVWEWTMDWYHPAYYKRTDSRDPKGPPDGVDKVIRGGGWAYAADDLRCSRRGRQWARIGGTNTGFRVVLEPQKHKKVLSLRDLQRELRHFK